MVAPVVRGDDLFRDYRVRSHRVQALRGVTIRLKPGEFLSLRGRSGSGKSTLLTILGLLDAPTSGKVWMAGRPVDFGNPSELGDLRRRHVGFLMQDAGVIERMSVIDNVMLPLRYADSRREARAAAMAALEKVGLAHLCERNVGQLSGGERQRTGLARAIVHRPDLLVCDEPSGALDLETTHIIARVLRHEAQRGAGLLVATHDPVLDTYADRCLALEAGQLVEVTRSSAASPPSVVPVGA